MAIMPQSAAAKGTLCAIEFVFLLGFIFLGARKGGINIGLAGGLGVLIFCMCFQLPVGALPLEVIEIIMCVIAAISCMQAAGGMAWLVSLAERVLRKRPNMITIVAPLITFLMTILVGTGHSAFSTLPVIAEVAKNAGVRPSRPLTAAVIASQVAICASPISAAVVALSGLMDKSTAIEGMDDADRYVISYVAIIGVCVPACLIATIITSIICNFLGKELADDPIYLERYKAGLTRGGPVPTALVGKDNFEASLEDGTSTHRSSLRSRSKSGASQTSASSSLSSSGSTSESIIEVASKKPEYPKGMWNCPAEKVSVAIFLVAIVFIVLYAILTSSTMKLTDNPPMDRTSAILAIMLGCACCISIVCKLKGADITAAPTFRSGMTAVICVIGVAWMGNTYIGAYQDDISRIGGEAVKAQPWLLSIVLLVASCLLYSQAVTVTALYPVALRMGVSKIVAMGSFPAASALFILPTYPTVVAAVEMDDTGSTKIGKYVFDHSFIIPGLIHVVLSVCLYYLFALMILH